MLTVIYHSAQKVIKDMNIMLHALCKRPRSTQPNWMAFQALQLHASHLHLLPQPVPPWATSSKPLDLENDQTVGWVSGWATQAAPVSRRFYSVPISHWNLIYLLEKAKLDDYWAGDGSFSVKSKVGHKSIVSLQKRHWSQFIVEWLCKVNSKLAIVMKKLKQKV